MQTTLPGDAYASTFSDFKDEALVLINKMDDQRLQIEIKFKALLTFYAEGIATKIDEFLANFV